MSLTYVNGDELFVSINFLVSKGLNRVTIHNGITKFNKGESTSWENIKHPFNRKIIYLNYDYVPKRTKTKHGLESKDQLLLSFHNKNKRNEAAKSSTLIISLKIAYESRWRKYLDRYQTEWIEPEESIFLSKSHAVVEELLCLRKTGIKVKDLFEAINSCNFDLKFKTSNPKWFYEKLNNFSNNGVTEELTHGNKNKKSNYSKLTTTHEKTIKQLYKDPKKLSVSEVHKRMNLLLIPRGFQEISLSSVKRFLAQKEIQNECNIFRNGIKWTDENLLSHLIRKKPEFVGDQWQIDASRLQFPYLNAKTGKVAYLTIFVVLDTHSSKIVGYSLDGSENKEMVIQGLMSAVENVGYFPREILCDNGKSFHSKEVKYIEDLTTLMGVEWRRSRLGNPRDKGNVERFFNTFQSTVCKLYKGYIGEGITSSRTNQTYDYKYKQNLLAPKNLMSKVELTNQTLKMIDHYNSQRLNNADSPDEKYIKGDLKNVVTYNKNEFVKIFWKSTIIKVRKSMINLTINKAKFSYSIWEEKLIYQLNNKQVRVFYDKEELGEIYLFDLKKDVFISVLRKDAQVQMSIVSQTAKDKLDLIKYSSKKKAIKKKIAENNQREKDFLSDIYGIEVNDSEHGKVIHVNSKIISKGSFFSKGSLEVINN
jgi:hypothetical protein